MRVLGASRGQVSRAVLLEAVVVGLLSSVDRADRRHRGRARPQGAVRRLRRAAARRSDDRRDAHRDRVVRGRHPGHRGGGLHAGPPGQPGRPAGGAARRGDARPVAASGRPSSGTIVLRRRRGRDDQVAGRRRRPASCSASAPCSRSSASRCCRRWSAGRSPRRVGRLFSRRLPGRLGRENAVRNPRRTAATAAALMIGLALISAVTVLGSSLKASVAKTVERRDRRRLHPQHPGPGLPGRRAQPTPKAGRRVAAPPGSRSTGCSCCDNASCSHAKQIFVTAFPAAAIGDLVNITTVDGSDDLEARTRS